IVTLKTFVQSNRVYHWMTEHVPFFGPVALALAPMVFAWVLFAVVYVILPNTRVRLSAALVGALVAGTAWNLMATVYVWYNARVVTNYKFYGGLGSIPIFLLWIYLSWVVVLFGAEIAFAVQHVETYKRQLESVKLSAADRDRLALVLVLEAVRTFEAGGAPPTAEGLAAKLDAPARVLHEVVYLLMDKGILREVSGFDAKDPGLVPGRDPSVMTVADVLHAVRTHGDPFGLPEAIGAREAYRLINEAEERASERLGRVTVKELAARTSSPPSA
ncbi:MAG TPA: YhjD/YihY/BrkB family envelope integrity protein, partial [Planctomycetota bacterium]|nr:YhjD/YihY/BrkB family envelope integrity protein [Planctomycetota bacterium]